MAEMRRERDGERKKERKSVSISTPLQLTTLALRPSSAVGQRSPLRANEAAAATAALLTQATGLHAERCLNHLWK